MDEQPILWFDPAYTDFKPGKTRLKYKTIMTTNPYIWRGLAVAIIFTILLLVFGREPLTFVALSVRGKPWSGNIISCEMDGTLYKSVPFVAYSYKVNGIRYRGETMINDANADCWDYGQGGGIALIYLPDAPRTSQVMLGKTINFASSSFMVGGVGFLALMTLIGWLFCGQALWRVWKWRRNGKYARLLDGKIAHATHLTLGKDGRYWLIVYGFQSPTGRWLEAEKHWDDTEARHSKAPKADMRVQVLYIDDKTFMAL